MKKKMFGFLVLLAALITAFTVTADSVLIQSGDSGDTVLQVQKKLSELGYYTSDIDGSYGQNTVDAVTRFQTEKDIDATGIVDDETYNSIMESEDGSVDQDSKENEIVTRTKREVSYSSNPKSTVRNGNSGVYTYKNRGGQYTVYYVIDFDEGYVYRFLDYDKSCDKVKIDSGDLNDVLIFTYHDGDDVWSNSMCFKWKNQPEHLLLQDDDGFLYDFYTADYDTVMGMLSEKTIIEY